ncbi:beta-galactosidase [Polaribacter sp. Hel_I_88]|uniref:beta-galactosidase n=1 Tax=Polaribacter sp. Hel_I_88 TaxID=1250006 RepID=UPI00047B8A08|nr:beta-galactosidase [Polaribacter sp. Hel_I_88]
MNKFIFTFLCFFITGSAIAQKTYEINIKKPEKKISRGHLNLGGKNNLGDEISVNSYFIELNKKPFFPIVGEFHFSRYPLEYWEESILKMKAGGINVIATYVFWNIHERKEGKFDWSKNLDLRKFIALVKKHNMFTIVRMGPFCHGEMRNGGIPDWMYGQKFEIRSNDPGYLKYVDILYGKIANQIEGLLYKDGGPIIGVQLENEYQGSAAPWEFSYPGSRKEYTVADQEAALANEQIAVTDGINPWAAQGKRHMLKLKEIAQKHGIDVPLYTVTGWSNAAIIEKQSLPVTAGYAYPFWSEPAPSKFYLFKDIHKNPDYSPVSYNAELYPSIPAELGPGIQVKYSRRPIVDYKSVSPLIVRTIGSGSNGIGYYMYHGGSTPSFEGKFYNEEVNGIPRINYDFQAPIGQYGQVRHHYKSLKMLHLFLESYADKLAPMKTTLPETNANIIPEDLETLRYSVRSFENSGFVFIVNFQDHLENKDIKDVAIEIQAENEKISFPLKETFSIPSKIGAIFPFNLELKNVVVKSATVQPLTILKNNNENHYVFSAINGITPEVIFSNKIKISKLKNAKLTKFGKLNRIQGNFLEPFSFEANGEKFLVITEEMALNANVIDENLIISNSLILKDNDSFQLISKVTATGLQFYPSSNFKPTVKGAGIEKIKKTKSLFTEFKVKFKEVKPEVIVEMISERKYTLNLKSDVSKLNDVFVEVDYIGDRGLAFIDGEMITDHLYHERKWEISLKDFVVKLQNNEMVFIFHPMFKEYEYLKDLKNVPKFKKGGYLEIKNFNIIPEYKAVIKF